jgi:DNA-binding SARP family transcriptional activator/tetratricopeptide (TPR) repeat protein
MAAEFRLLGNIEVLAGDRPIPIGYAQLQGVLAALLVDANVAVSVDHLVDRVWGTRRLPRRPRSAVQHAVSLLRRVLAAVPEVAVESSAAGYRLTVDPAAVDLHRFHGLVDQARGTEDDEHAVKVFERALGLWRGEPFGGLDTPWFASMRATLLQQRLTVRLDLIDVRLRLGRHAALLADLADLAERHPLDERVAGQYVQALYRCGRQADALEHYERVRRLLAEQLGADPSPPLRRLHQQILTGDPALAPQPAARRVLPRQLPAGPRLFTGRGRELAVLTAVLDRRPAPGTALSAVVISAIGGTGGVGKTWLALHWAHQHLDRFPDGQLHVNLRGFDPVGQPVPPGTVLRGFLDALGVDPSGVPVDLDAQAALYRSLVAGRRMLIMLDNARDAAQVEPLLPGSPTCTVVVTSRRRLSRLVTAHGAHQLDLDVLTEPEARELLTSHLGHARIAAEPETAAELLACCAGLPLALSVLAARANTHPDFPLAALADELRERTGRLDALDALDTGDRTTNLRAVLSSSYHALPTEAASVFELLGLAPGPDIGLPAAASLTALPASRVRRNLQTLEGAHLVQQHRPGRYRMHDLVRLYAADRAQRGRHADTRESALRRLVDFYLHTAFAGDRLLDRHRRLVELGDPAPGCLPQPLHDEATAQAWFAVEYPNLLASQHAAADRGWHARVWQLAWVLDSFHYRRGQLQDALAMWQTGLAAADRLGDPVTQTRAHRRLGNTYDMLRQPDRAVEHLHRALELAGKTGDVVDQAQTHLIIGWMLAGQQQHRRALEHATRALRLFETLDEPVWKADALHNVGCHLAQLGDYEQAHAYCTAALALLERHPDRHCEADTLDSLGFIAHNTGRFEQARDYYEQALTRFRALGHAYQEAGCLERLGDTQHALGQHDGARATWQQAMELYRAQHRTDDADRVLRRLDALTPAR